MKEKKELVLPGNQCIVIWYGFKKINHTHFEVTKKWIYIQAKNGQTSLSIQFVSPADRSSCGLTTVHVQIAYKRKGLIKA